MSIVLAGCGGGSSSNDEELSVDIVEQGGSQEGYNLSSYTVSDHGLTVYDNVTGLTWTQSADLDGDIDADDKLTYDQA